MSESQTLNLLIDGNIKLQAKSYAKNHKTSVSHLVEDYLRELLKGNEESTYIPKSKTLRSLVGILGEENREYTNAKDGYHRHLEKKYLND